MASIAERLNALYGDAARLELHARDTQGTEAVIEIPYEHAPSRLA
jgi:LytS/YehU family sensor histidine kinase